MTTTTLDFVEMLRELIRRKINQYRDDLHKSHNHIDKDRLLIQIWALEWVLGQIYDIENKER
jgi:hypothetical protein